MPLPHLDCTSPERRVQICQDYDVHADDCIYVIGDSPVISDARRHPITDRYYQFSVYKHESDNPSYVIVCGAGAARHFCQLINQTLPRSFNPFVEEHEPANRVQDHDNIPQNENNVQWNPIRRQLYYAVQLFITRYQEVLTPGTSIFKISQKLCQNYVQCLPYESYFKGFTTIVDKFHTNIPKIINELAKHGHIRNFDFSQVRIYMSDALDYQDNIFCEDHFN